MVVIRRPGLPAGFCGRRSKHFRKVDRIGGLLARELALAARRESGAGEALVWLEYIPGCEGPVSVDIRLDGRPASLPDLPRTAAIPRDNLTTWQRYIAARIPLVDLARWGHQQPGMPWEEATS